MASLGNVSASTPGAPENRVWQKSFETLATRLGEPLQTAGRHQENGGAGYDYAVDSLLAAEETASITTPYAVEAQSASAEAQAALSQAQNGATLYRTGQLGTSMTGESQYWSLQNPLLNPNYAAEMGMPGVTPDFIMTGTLNPGASVIANEAPGLGANLGGKIQIVTQPGGVGNLGFHMP